MEFQAFKIAFFRFLGVVPHTLFFVSFFVSAKNAPLLNGQSEGMIFRRKDPEITPLSSRSRLSLPGLRLPGPRPEGSKPLLSPSGKDQEEEEEEEEERERERESFIRNNLHNGVVSGAEEEEEEEEGLFKADAVNEEDPERDRDLSLIV